MAHVFCALATDCRTGEPTYRHPPVSRRGPNSEEQLIGSGVYINMFEQSILIDNRPNKSWSLLASLSAELVAVSVMILIPLLYGDRLPDFHWHVVTVGPPVPQIETPPTPTSARPSSGPARTVFQPPTPNWNPSQTTQSSAPVPGPTTLEPPTGLGNSYADGSQLSTIVGRTAPIKPPPPVPAPLRSPRAPFTSVGASKWPSW